MDGYRLCLGFEIIIRIKFELKMLIYKELLFHILYSICYQIKKTLLDKV